MTSDGSHPLLPKEIILEVTNVCNLRCRYCHFHGRGVKKRRSLGCMARETWERALDELQDWPQPVTLMTHGAGEPLLHPQLYDILKKAKGISGLQVGFMTNGMFLDNSWSERLLDIGLDWMAFSIDGVIPLTHDAFRVNADLTKIERYVDFLIEEKERRGCNFPILTFNMVGYPEILDQVNDYVRRWLPFAETVMVSLFRPIGSRRLWDGNSPFPFRPCPLLNHQMVISYDGQVGLCCEDIHLDVPIGRISFQTLEQVYNESPVLQEYRKRHQDGHIDRLTLCRDCQVWGGNILLKKENMQVDGMTVEKTVTPAFQSYRKV